MARLLRIQRVCSCFFSLRMNVNHETGRGLIMGFPLPVYFSIQFESILEKIRVAIEELNQLKKEVEAIQAYEEKEWLTAPQFGQLSGLSAKTVSNYCGAGRIQRCRKNSEEQWEIHVSELERISNKESIYRRINKKHVLP